MKAENEVLVMLTEVLQKQDRASKENEVRFDRLEARVGGLEGQLNKVNWRHEDLAAKHDDLRHAVAQTEKSVMAVAQSVTALTQAVAVMLAQQTQMQTRVRRLERPNDFGPQSAVA